MNKAHLVVAIVVLAACGGNPRDQLVQQILKQLDPTPRPPSTPTLGLPDPRVWNCDRQTALGRETDPAGIKPKIITTKVGFAFNDNVEPRRHSDATCQQVRGRDAFDAITDTNIYFQSEWRLHLHDPKGTTCQNGDTVCDFGGVRECREPPTNDIRLYPCGGKDGNSKTGAHGCVVCGSLTVLRETP